MSGKKGEEKKAKTFDEILAEIVPLHQKIDNGIRQVTELYRGKGIKEVPIETGEMKDGKPVIRNAKSIYEIVSHLDSKVRKLLQSNIDAAKKNDIELQQYLPSDLTEISNSIGNPKIIGEQTVGKLYQAFVSSYFQKVFQQIGAAVAKEKEPEKKAKLVQMAHAIAGTGRESEDYTKLDHQQQMNQINEAYQAMKSKFGQQIEYKDQNAVMDDIINQGKMYMKKSAEAAKKLPKSGSADTYSQKKAA